MANKISKAFIKKLIASSQKAENLHALRIQRALEDEMQFKVLELQKEGFDLKELDIKITSLRALKSIHQANQAIYQHGLNDLVDELAKYVKFAPSYGKINIEDQKRISAITTHTITNLSGIVSNMKAPLIDAIQTGRDLGEGHLKISRRVQNVFQSDRVAADRFARTEGNALYNQSHFSKMQEAGIEMCEFVNPDDNRTSAICLMYNGSIWALDDPDLQQPPLHWNCRSRLLAFIGEGYPTDANGDLLPRDYTDLSDGTTISQEKVDQNIALVDNFRNKYWDVPQI